MNIRETTVQQLQALVAHLYDTSKLDVSQLGSEWEARKEALRRDAVFLETFVIPDVEAMEPREMTAFKGRREGGAKLIPDDSQARNPFLRSGAMSPAGTPLPG